MDKRYIQEYGFLEQNHWWFKARLKILSFLVEKTIQQPQKSLSILNIGAATGETSIMLEKFGEVTTVEYDDDFFIFLKDKLKTPVFKASITNLPFEKNSFDLVCAFDVIEHVQNDLLALTEINRVLKTNGNYVITVPAYSFLWSKHDIVNHHVRRYTKNNLSSKIEQSNLSVGYNTYFNFFLFIPIAIVRFFKLNSLKSTNKKNSDFDFLKKKKFLNTILYKLFLHELIYLKLGIKFPFGISFFVSGRKALLKKNGN